MTNESQRCPRCLERGKQVRMWRAKKFTNELKCPVCGFRLVSSRMWGRKEARG